MGSIFISYRRTETASEAASLYRALTQAFGPDLVFMDSRALRPGNLLPETIRGHLESCDALIALIGRQWLHIQDGHGRRRLDLPNDYVRMEIATALDRKILVIPVLVQSAIMPTAEELPHELAPLVHHLALELSPISDLHWDYDVDRLVNALELAISVPFLRKELPSLRLPDRRGGSAPSAGQAWRASRAKRCWYTAWYKPSRGNTSRVIRSVAGST